MPNKCHCDDTNTDNKTNHKAHSKSSLKKDNFQKWSLLFSSDLACGRLKNVYQNMFTCPRCNLWNL